MQPYRGASNGTSATTFQALMSERRLWPQAGGADQRRARKYREAMTRGQADREDLQTPAIAE
jgi:hypothetical protein